MSYFEQQKVNGNENDFPFNESQYIPNSVLQEISEQLEQGEELHTFDFFRALVRHDPNILGLELLPYQHYWEEKDGTRDIKRNFGSTIHLDRDKILDPNFSVDQEVKTLREKTGQPYWNIAIKPTIKYRGKAGEETRYLGLMDMGLHGSELGNQELLLDNLKIVFNDVNDGGVIANSGGSYHYISNRLFTSRTELLKFYGRCLLLTVPTAVSETKALVRIAEERYVGRILTEWDSPDWEKYNTLRLTTGSPNKPYTYSPKITSIMKPSKIS